VSLFTIKQINTQQILLKCKNHHARIIERVYGGQEEIAFLRKTFSFISNKGTRFLCDRWVLIDFINE